MLGGANFAVFSRHATRIWLEFFDRPEAAAPTRRFVLTTPRHRTGDIWHIWVGGVRAGQLYGYRAEGPYQPDAGHRYNPNRLLLDPCAMAVTHLERWNYDRAADDRAAGEEGAPRGQEDNAAYAPKSIVTDVLVDWEGEHRPHHAWRDTVIYELHVRGFTVHASSGVRHPGTYRGLTEKIPYLKDLGVTTVELMPVQEFNEHELSRYNPITGERLRNFWGYNPAAFLAPNGAYSSTGAQGAQKAEFVDMVKAFHRAGIEVLIDVVFNHTAESDERGPTLSWRGLDNRIYYILDGDGGYLDYSGTGNSLRADHPVVRDHILDALRHWVIQMGVDGFRFDLASVLGRDQDGALLADPPLLERIAEDPVLRDVKIIAEAWDAAGAYQVGSFSRHRWAEWNGRYRDDVRRFWRGDPGMAADFASRLCGSADLYRGSGRGPESSINYVASHDGFTLSDLVSYARKHNEANGERNRDGTDCNYSANYGVEGPTDDPGIEAVRVRQIKNFLLTLFVSRGVPMLLAGDEFRRSQGGNNNAYCQDNEVSWVDWQRLLKHRDVHRFARELIAFRQRRRVLREPAFYAHEEVFWFDATGRPPAWHDAGLRHLGCRIATPRSEALLLLFNAGTGRVAFALPEPEPDARWCRKIDTARPAPGDMLLGGREQPLPLHAPCTLAPRSGVVCIASPR